MFQAAQAIHPVPILAAAVASFILGGIWFAGLFARPYAVALGRAHLPKEKPAPLFLIGPFLCGLVSVAVSAVLIAVLNIRSVAEAAAFGALVGAGYLASTTVNTAINPNMPRPLLYGLISGGYFFLSGIVGSVVLVLLN